MVELSIRNHEDLAYFCMCVALAKYMQDNIVQKYVVTMGRAIAASKYVERLNTFWAQLGVFRLIYISPCDSDTQF